MIPTIVSKIHELYVGLNKKIYIIMEFWLENLELVKVRFTWDRQYLSSKFLKSGRMAGV